MNTPHDTMRVGPLEPKQPSAGQAHQRIPVWIWRLIDMAAACLIGNAFVRYGLIGLPEADIYPYVEAVFLNETYQRIGAIIALVVIVGIAYAVASRRRFMERVRVSALVTSFILSGMSVLSFSLQMTHDKTMNAFGGPWMFTLVMLGIWAALYLALDFLWEKLDTKKLCPKETGYARVKPWMIEGGIILVCWLPVLLIHYPGSVARDTRNQIMMMLGYRDLDASNPVVVTWLFGLLFQLGRAMGSDDLGIFLCLMIQSGLCLIAMTLVCGQVRRLTGRRVMGIVTALFFGLVPEWGAALQCVLKDIVHLSFFLFFFLYACECLKKRALKPRDMIVLVVLGILTALTRKAALMIIVVSGLTWLAYPGEKALRIKRMIPLAAIVAVVVACQSLLYPALGFADPRESENYSLPFQQVARYCVVHQDEMSVEDIAVINGVLNYDKIIADYDPLLSDPVKSTYHGDKASMQAFWRLYTRLLTQHPMDFVQSIVATSYMYFDPLSIGSGSYREYIAESENYQVTRAFKQATSRYSLYIDGWEKPSLRSLLIGPGLYSWLLIICIGYLCHRRRFDKLVLLMPVIVLMLGFLFTHVNGENRYALPLIAAAPFFLALTARQGA